MDNGLTDFGLWPLSYRLSFVKIQRKTSEKGHGSNNIPQPKRTPSMGGGTTKPKIREGASFSEIMGDLLVGKPPIPGVRRTG